MQRRLLPIILPNQIYWIELVLGGGIGFVRYSFEKALHRVYYFGEWSTSHVLFFKKESIAERLLTALKKALINNLKFRLAIFLVFHAKYMANGTKISSIKIENCSDFEKFF